MDEEITDELKQGITQELEQLQVVYDTIINFFLTYSFQLIGAAIILIIGMIVANRVSKVVLKLCENKSLDITLSRFLANAVKIFIVVMVAIICLNKIGISVTPFVAAIGAASLGAGLAVQGLLSNYGAGFNIIFTRPFVVGDTIKVQGVHGQVRDIFLAYTILVTEDDEVITVPNRHIVGEIIHNTKSVSLLELGVGVAYSSDLDQVTKVIEQAVQKNAHLSKDKVPMIGIAEFGDSSVNFEIRAWVDSDNINAARFAINKSIWDALNQNNISIPFPQREVRMLDS